MSFFNANVTGVVGGLVTKFEKSVTINSNVAEIVVNISEDVSNYKDITNEQIIVELSNVYCTMTGYGELSHTYDPETGNVTITSTNSAIPFATASDVTINLTIYIAGSVQLPPAPEGALYKLGTGNIGTVFNVSDYPNYKNFTRDNFIVTVDSFSNSQIQWGTGALDARLAASSGSVSVNFDSVTGNVTLTGGYSVKTGCEDGWGNHGGATALNVTIRATVYLHLGEIIK